MRNALSNQISTCDKKLNYFETPYLTKMLEQEMNPKKFYC